MKNPWPGLASYTEDTKNQFKGRSAASATLSALIRRNLFVTLYGRSGIGKTSLLQAGVYPLLRGEGLCPITIRLNDVKDERKKKNIIEVKGISQEEAIHEEAPAAELLWEKLLAELDKIGVQYRPCDENDIYIPEYADVMVLRSLFSAGRFINADNKEVTPVIVLDQFEEVLYKAPTASRLLVSQLYALIDDNYNLTIPHPTWHEDTIFRIVISIREDDLFLFEDCIDTLNCADFKSNRYRLMPLTVEEAKEVILAPATGMFASDEEEEVVERVISISRNQGESINTLMLSLLCHVLFDKFSASANSKPVTEADLADYDDIIKVYYQSILKGKKLLKANGKPIKDISWIEDNLIDEQGRRKSVYLSDLEKNAPKAKDLADNSNNRLLNISQDRVEFIHDQLAASVFKIRTHRKTKKFRKWGNSILIAALLVLFLVSLSFLPEQTKEEESSVEKIMLSDNTKVIKYTIEDSIQYFVQDYVISNCPNLKTIEIKKNRASLHIYNCPNLVKIYHPKDYTGHIDAYNCINIVKDSIISKYATSFENDYESEVLQGITFNTSTSDYYKYDSVNKSFEIYTLPSSYGNIKRRGVNFKGEIKLLTHLPDSVKRVTKCYVPYGYRDKFLQLCEFQSFQEIEEMPIYYTWLYHIKRSCCYLQSNSEYFYLFVCFIVIVQLFFLFVGYKSFKKRSSKQRILLLFALIFSIGMSVVAVLSFVAFYWFVFNILKPYNHDHSVLMGFIGSILCMAIINRDSVFYELVRSFKVLASRVKAIGIFSTISEFPKRISKTIYNQFTQIKQHRIKFILVCSSAVILTVVGISLWVLYVDGKKERIHYLDALSHVHFARVPAIIDALEEQHGSFLYPFFTDSLNNIKQQIHRNEISVVHITPKYIKDIARWNGVDLSASDIYLKAVSNDGSGLCIEISNNYTGIEQMVYYDFFSEKFDTISASAKREMHETVFSPSDKTLLSYNYQGSKPGFIYNVSTHGLKKLPASFPYDEKVIMTSDNDYYYLDGDILYNGCLNSNNAPSEVRCFESLSLDYIYHIDSENIGVADRCNNNFIIYNLKQDSIIYHSKNHNDDIIAYYDMRGINSKCVVSREGVFDLKQDSLIESDSDMYMWNNQPIEIRMEDCKFVLRDINGRVIKTFAKDKNDASTYIYAIRNIYLYTYSDSSIFIYNIGAKLNRNVKITDYDKKVFDLE